MPDPNGRPYLSEKIDGVSIEGGAAVGSDGGYGVRRAELTGDVTAPAGSNVTTIANAAVAAIGALTPAADRIAYFTSASAAALATLTTYARTLLDDADASAAQTTLGLSAFVKTLIDDASAAAFLTTLGVSSFVQTVLDDADAATARTTLGFADSVWTPTLTNGANAASSVSRQCVYSRVGNTVHFSGQIEVTATAFPTATFVDLSLPVASNLGTVYDLAGVVTHRTEAAYGAGAMEGNATDNRATLGFFSVAAASHTLFFSGSYRVL